MDEEIPRLWKEIARLNAEIARLNAEIAELKELRQGPRTNWAKVKDATERACAAERCSARWLRERDDARRKAVKFNIAHYNAMKQVRELRRRVDAHPENILRARADKMEGGNEDTAI